MDKKYWFSCMLMVTLIFSNTVIAKTKECIVKPSYNIVINSDYVKVVNDRSNLIIKPSGIVNINGHDVKIKSAIQKEAKEYQAYLREQLPLFENEAYKQLNDVRLAFEIAIRDKLGNQSELLSNLNKLHIKLVELLHKSIVTTDGVTYFYYQPFNHIKKDGEEIGKTIFYKIVGDSILSFNVFKNYSAIKKIAKDEWKQQKTELKQFDEHVCELITKIDDRYNHLMIGLTF